MVQGLPNCWDEADQKAVRGELARIVKSRPFQQSQRRQRFLEYVVSETLAGRGDRLKAYNIALEVFDRPATFDPVVDPIVRIEAARLRDKLREYYDSDGQGDPVHIELPRGGYAPLIEFTKPGAPCPPPETTSSSAKSIRLSRGALAVASMVGVILMAAAGFVGWRWLNAPPQPDRASIAVLPFENIGSEPQWDRFADGMTEDIITDLSHSKDLLVVARNSTEAYRGKSADVRNIGRDLGVRYVLEGSIQPAGDQIRVTAQLVDARTGGHVWSNRYDRPATDLFKVQSDVTEKIAATLTGHEGAVADAERSLIRRKSPNSLTAYEAYLLGMEAKHKVTREGVEEGERLFRKALEIDPQLARAYVGLVYICQYKIDLGLGTSVPDDLAMMMDSARNAVQLDPNDGETQLVLGHAFVYNHMPDQAREQFARAEALAPNNADILLLIAWYLPQLGETERAVRLADKALSLNPKFPHWYNQGFYLAYFFGRQFEKAVKYAKLVTVPYAADFAFLAAASAMTGDMAAARIAAEEVGRLDPDWNAEIFLSNSGGFPDDIANVLLEATEKAGVNACVPANRLASLPNLIRIDECNEERAKQATSKTTERSASPP